MTAKVTWRQTGPVAFSQLISCTTLCPDRVIDVIRTAFCQVSWTMTPPSSFQQFLNVWYPFQTHHLLSPSTEYVNQEIQDLRPGILERPTTLPRNGSRADRRLANGLSSGHSVENTGYLVPAGTRTPTSPAFDNPYYLDHLAKVKTGDGASGVNDPEGLETDGVMPRHMNGFVTPTAENPEYLGLADTLVGHTWGHGLTLLDDLRRSQRLVCTELQEEGKMDVCERNAW